jgi:hypothetical protein
MNTLKPRYNNPFYNKILAIKNLISSPSVVNLRVQIPCNNKIPAIKNKTSGPFRFVIPRFLCTKVILFSFVLFCKIVVTLRRPSLGGRVCFQWVPAHCGLPGNERADEQARKAADLGPEDGAQRWRISFEVVKRLIRSQVKDGPPNHARMHSPGVR